MILCIFQHPNITFQDILNHPELEWDMYSAMCNPNITLDHIRSHPEFTWDEKTYLLHNPTITFKDVLDHPEIEWHPYVISTKKYRYT
mgnify:FL=1